MHFPCGCPSDSVCRCKSRQVEDLLIFLLGFLSGVFVCLVVLAVWGRFR